jgi:hypothetical protein
MFAELDAAGFKRWVSSGSARRPRDARRDERPSADVRKVAALAPGAPCCGERSAQRSNGKVVPGRRDRSGPEKWCKLPPPRY